MRLEVGATTDKVTVTAEAALLEDASPTLNAHISRLQLSELPQSRRDLTSLLTLQPGARAGDPGLFSLNGLPLGGMSVTVDGVDGAGDVETNSTGMFQGFNYINVMSQEAIAEVDVSKGVFSAEVGRTLSANINVITRGGTNQFHGSLFENWQNDILNARYALLASTAAKPPVRFNQLGSSLGGPIWKNKMFFFTAYEGYRQSSFTTITGQVPTPELKQQAIAAVPGYEKSLNLWPNPTEPYAANAVTGLYRGAASNTADDNHVVARYDYNLSDDYRLALRYRRGRPNQSIPSLIPANPRNYIGVTESGNATLTRGSAGWTWETRFGFNYNDTARAEGVHYNGKTPLIAMQGAFSATSETLIVHGYSWSIEQVFQRAIGRHVIKAGGIYLDRAPHRFDEEVPVFTYPNLAALLANHPSAIRVTFGQPDYDGHAWELGFFVQDDFRVNRNLILNLGVRYEYFSVYRDNSGHLYNPDGIPGAVSVPACFRPQDEFLHPDRNNFSPRVGLAWSIDNSGSNVIRTGFGMAYAPFSLRTFASAHYQNPDLPFRFNFGQSEINNFNIKFPMTNEQFAQFVNGAAVPRAYLTTYAGMLNPETYQWTFDYQRKLTDSLMFQMGYVGNKATHLTMSHALNQPDWNTGIRPYPNTLAFTYRDDGDFSYYHGWQSSIRKRFQAGLTVNAHYTWSRTMATSQGDTWIGVDTSVQDENNWRADKGPTNLDVPHNFVADFIYEAPLGKLAGSSKGLRNVLGGWHIAGIFSATSGTPLNISESSNRSGSRPDYAGGNPYYAGSDRFQWLNAAAFTQVPIVAASGGTIRPGNVGKNWLRTADRWNLDFSVSKNFVLTEKARLQVRADAFNATNSVILGAPITDVRNASFGRILTVGQARRMQLNARLTF